MIRETLIYSGGETDISEMNVRLSFSVHGNTEKNCSICKKSCEEGDPLTLTKGSHVWCYLKGPPVLARKCFKQYISPFFPHRQIEWTPSRCTKFRYSKKTIYFEQLLEGHRDKYRNCSLCNCAFEEGRAIYWDQTRNNPLSHLWCALTSNKFNFRKIFDDYVEQIPQNDENISDDEEKKESPDLIVETFESKKTFKSPQIHYTRQMPQKKNFPWFLALSLIAGAVAVIYRQMRN